MKQQEFKGGIIKLSNIKKSETELQQNNKKTTMNSNIKSKAHKEVEKWSKYLMAKNY